MSGTTVTIRYGTVRMHRLYELPHVRTLQSQKYAWNAKIHHPRMHLCHLLTRVVIGTCGVGPVPKGGATGFPYWILDIIRHFIADAAAFRHLIAELSRECYGR